MILNIYYCYVSQSKDSFYDRRNVGKSIELDNVDEMRSKTAVVHAWDSEDGLCRDCGACNLAGCHDCTLPINSVAKFIYQTTWSTLLDTPGYIATYGWTIADRNLESG